MDDYDKAVRDVIMDAARNLYPGDPELQEAFITGAEYTNRPEFKEEAAWRLAQNLKDKES